MKFYAQKMEFEKAQWIKDKIKDLKNFQSKSTIVNQKINNVDVFSIFSDEGQNSPLSQKSINETKIV